MNREEFIKENCKDCKESCEKGIIENADFLYCADTDKKEFKNISKSVDKF